MLYEQYMRSPAWAEKRQQRLQIDKHECRLCGCKERLEVHHKPDSYRKLPNESVEDDLTTLCVECHDLITNRIREARYQNKHIMVIEHTSTPRKVVDHGRSENIEVQAHRNLPRYLSQRATEQPDGLLCETDESGIVKKKKD